MRLSFTAPAALLLAACAAPAADLGLEAPLPAAVVQPPLASDAEIDASITAPLEPTAASMEWNAPSAPFKVIGNIHYVGSKTVGAYLVTTPDGHFLVDGIVPQSAPLILENIRALGFDPADVKYLLNSHAHIDHAGGLAALKRATGAIMVASAADTPILEAGDVFYGPSKGMKFPPVRVDQIIDDGETLSLGGVILTAHLTPGHTPGCTSWSLPVAGVDGAAHTAFLHCSSTVAGQRLVPESYPGMIDSYRATFEKVRTLEADIFLANHDNFFGLAEKRARLAAGDANAFVDAEELQAFNTAMEAAFETQLAMEEDMAR
ncbi:subclass B3 metallo-beta-lactamase [Hyphomonas sp.]|jgi:metallo-beta-lactamase class B|uniref:subclass B3 metallo-beta-lactamase n=1 Tax=Hyphomonas sp. TaxID=87 RepID=UPI0025C2B8A2|nr:subclass B3 metallo-beta-lactamase [Hyphomonas sp.]